MKRTRLLALLLAAMMIGSAQTSMAADLGSVTAPAAGYPVAAQDDKSVETSLSSLEHTTVGATTEFTVTTRGATELETMVYGCFTVNSSEPDLRPDGDMTIQYYETALEGQGWQQLPSNYFGPEEGFPFNALGDPMESKFKVTFHKPGEYEVVVLIKEKDGDEIVCQTAPFTVNVAAEEEEEEEETTLIRDEEGLKQALAKGGVVELESGADITLTSELTISQAVTLKAGTNATLRAQGEMRSAWTSAITVAGVRADFENITIDAGDQAEYALSYTDGASGSLQGVTVTGGSESDLLVDGAQVSLGAGSSAGQTELAKTGGSTPSLEVQTGASTKVWVDHDSYTALGLDGGSLEEGLGQLVTAQSGSVQVVVGTAPGATPENGQTVTVEPETEEEEPDDEDAEEDGEEETPKPEKRPSRTGGDYFGNARWDELKAKIADAEEGSTLEMSATGLPWLPSSVVRAIRGRDITLKIRKGGVTYTLNGEKVGPIVKIWYNFDEKLESTLQPVKE